MWPDRVSNPGPLTYESGVLPIALRGPAKMQEHKISSYVFKTFGGKFGFDLSYEYMKFCEYKKSTSFSDPRLLKSHWENCYQVSYRAPTGEETKICSNSPRRTFSIDGKITFNIFYRTN